MEHKGEFAATPFAKPLFCRKLYVAQGRSPHRAGCPHPAEMSAQKLRRKRSMNKTAAGSHGTEQYSCMSAASCSFVQGMRNRIRRNKGCGAGVPLPFLFVRQWKERVWIMVRKVAVIMGSDSDWPVVKGACAQLKRWISPLKHTSCRHTARPPRRLRLPRAQRPTALASSCARPAWQPIWPVPLPPTLRCR